MLTAGTFSTPQTWQVCHVLPGRIRLKIKGLKDNLEGMSALQQPLAAIQGVRCVETSALTGSVLIAFDPAKAHSFEFLAQICEALDIAPADIDPNLLEALVQNPATTESATPIRMPTLEGMSQTINLGLLVPGILTTFGIWSLLKSKAIGPAWYDYFWFAFGSYFMLNPEARAPKQAVSGPGQDNDEH